jgi:hypothetical protein
MIFEKLRDLIGRFSFPQRSASENIERSIDYPTSEFGDYGLKFPFPRDWAHHPRLVDLAAIVMAGVAWSFMAGRQ